MRAVLKRAAVFNAYLAEQGRAEAAAAQQPGYVDHTDIAPHAFTASLRAMLSPAISHPASGPVIRIPALKRDEPPRRSRRRRRSYTPHHAPKPRQVRDDTR